MIRIAGRLPTDNTAATYAVVTLGLGLGFTPLWQIRHLVDGGQLEVVLTEFEASKVPIHAVSPATKLPLIKVQLLTEFLGTYLRENGVEGGLF